MVRAIREGSVSNITYEDMVRDADNSWLPTGFEIISCFNSIKWSKGVPRGAPSTAQYRIVAEVVAPVARWLKNYANAWVSSLRSGPRLR